MHQMCLSSITDSLNWSIIHPDSSSSAIKHLGHSLSRIMNTVRGQTSDFVSMYEWNWVDHDILISDLLWTWANGHIPMGKSDSVKDTPFNLNSVMIFREKDLWVHYVIISCNMKHLKVKTSLCIANMKYVLNVLKLLTIPTSTNHIHPLKDTQMSFVFLDSSCLEFRATYKTLFTTYCRRSAVLSPPLCTYCMSLLFKGLKNTAMWDSMIYKHHTD